MKQVQWFPGHMFKSLKEIKQKVKLMDIVFVLLDARLPFSSMNPTLSTIIDKKPCLLLFNKSDLADMTNLSYWLNYYKSQGYHTLLINSISGKNINKIHPTCEIILKEKIAKNLKRGIKQTPIRAMILGIPNVGKSTLINALTKTKATKTGNKPGVTKAQQWIKISNNFELLDTPGILWPKFDDPKVGLALAVTGAIKDDTLPLNAVVDYAIDYLIKYYPKRFVSRYDVDIKLPISEIIEQIAIKRGALLKGGLIDEQRVYEIILTDLRSGILGGLSFDQPTNL